MDKQNNGRNLRPQQNQPQNNHIQSRPALPPPQVRPPQYPPRPPQYQSQIRPVSPPRPMPNAQRSRVNPSPAAQRPVMPQQKQNLSSRPRVTKLTPKKKRRSSTLRDFLLGLGIGFAVFIPAAIIVINILLALLNI